MKKLFIVGGTMGVGKTTVCRELLQQLPDAVFLDGDWCWNASPFQVTDETKQMVMQNISFLLNQFIHCSAYKNVIFCWVLHQQSILDALVNSLDTENCEVIPVSLVCSKEALTDRLQKDIDAGFRTPDILERSIARIPLYQSLNTVKIETDGKTPAELADEIGQLSL